MATVAMSFEAAGLDNAARLAHWTRQCKALLPVAILELDELPVIGPEFVKHNDFGIELFADLKSTLLAHDGAGIAHAAAVANRKRTGAHGLDLAQDRHQRILMSGAGRWIRAVEIGLDKKIFAAEFVETGNKADSALHRSEERRV